MLDSSLHMLLVFILFVFCLISKAEMDFARRESAQLAELDSCHAQITYTKKRPQNAFDEDDDTV